MKPARVCENCGNLIPVHKRKDTRFCKPECAWQKRVILGPCP